MGPKTWPWVCEHGNYVKHGQQHDSGNLRCLCGLNFPLCFTGSRASLWRLILTPILVAGQRSSLISVIFIPDPDHWFVLQSELHGFAFFLFSHNSSILLLCYFELRLSSIAATSRWGSISCFMCDLDCAGERIWLLCTSKDFLVQLGEIARLSESLAWYPNSGPCLARHDKGLAQELNMLLLPHPHDLIIS